MVLYRRPVPKERRQSCLSQLQCTMSFVTDVGEFWRTVLFLYINRDKICLAEYMSDEIIKKRWKKITSKQFDTLLDAILKDFQSNETNEVRKNWDIAYHRISMSICQWNVR